MSKVKKDYALYRGDEFVAIGTADELAALTGCKRHTILEYATPRHKKRRQDYQDAIIVIALD